MRQGIVKAALLSLAVALGPVMAKAQTVTVGPSGQYATPCQAFPHLTNGETVQVDANGGIPYNDSTDCTISADNLTIVGVNGRPVIDGSGLYTSKGLWILNGHDIVVDNFEFRNSSGDAYGGLFRIQVGDGALNNATDGGNITLQHSYLHDALGQGAKGADANQYGSGLNWYSSNPYITFQYDEFSNNGDHNGGGEGGTHNMYMGYGGNMTFTLQYSWTHDSFAGHNIKTRAPYNNILYNMDTDFSGNSNYLLDDCLGSSDYAIGNVFEKSAVSTTSGTNASQNWFIFADYTEDNDGPEYGTDHQDLHFINNTVVDDPSNGYPPQFISISCGNSTQSSCPAPGSGGPAETVPAVIESNIFVGPAGNAITNQSNAYVAGNVVQTYSDSQLAADFVDWTHYDFHLASGSPGIGAGIYPPTNNSGAADPKALAQYEPLMPTGAVPRPTPSGSTMDAGAYSYPRVDTPPSPSLSYTSNVTAPGTGTITISGLPTPASGSYNYAAFISQNPDALPNPSSADSTTGTITTTFSVNPSVTQTTTVPIDIYVMGAHLVANVTVNPGPPVLSSITQDYGYQPFTTVHLEGPAPAGGTVIDLSSSDPTYLYVPSTVTVPQGQISAETGSGTGSLWGQSPQAPTETITATQGSVTKTISLAVFTPAFHGTSAETTSVSGGSPLAWCVVMVGDWPASGGSIQVTSSNTAVIPNQTITAGYANCNGTLSGQVINFSNTNFDGDIAIATNPVSSNTTVNVTLTLNGDSSNGSGGSNTTAITVTPGGSVSVPGAPSGLSASASSASEIDLNWTASGTSGVTYSVYRSTSNGFTPGSGNQVASGVTGTSYADTGLSASTTYYYLVEAVNSAGNSGASNQASATTGSSGGGGGVSPGYYIDLGGAAETEGGLNYESEATAEANGLVLGSGTQAWDGTGNPVTPSPSVDSAMSSMLNSGIYASASSASFIVQVAPGTYHVSVGSLENYQSNFRSFDLVLNGSTVATGIGSQPYGQWTEYGPYTVTVGSNGQLAVNLNRDSGDPSISYIKIVPVSPAVYIDLGGPAETEGGVSYESESTAEANGLTLASGTMAWNSTSNPLTPSPSVDSAMSSMLNSGVYASASSAAFTLPIAPGNYKVSVGSFENYQSNFRSFDLLLNGTTAATGIGSLPYGGWAEYGPYNVTVGANGQLAVNLNRDSGDPSISYIKITPQ